ncbi:hypothetical protein ACHAXS_007835 [Conticribra weissflogii]
MGVPKFFRWLSERYPLINQPIHCPPEESTKKSHGFPPSLFATDEEYSKIHSMGKTKRDARKNTDLPHIMPEFDRLYLDMNGIIHCASHNNSEEEDEKPNQRDNEGNGNNEADIKKNEAFNEDSNPPLAVGAAGQNSNTAAQGITEEQIFQNVCYYLDRVITDIVQPKELVYLAIDGVAPRAKLNQQRSRRYRSGTEKEIEMHLMTLQQAQEKGDVDSESRRREFIIEADGGGDDGYWWEDISRSSPPDKESASRGSQRFSGTVEASSSGAASSGSISPSNASISISDDKSSPHGFHSNCITPGTPFLHKCSQRIVEFVKHKLAADPRWKDLTIVFSGHDVPGEGEHKIMDFIRHEKRKPGYDPNTRHCIYGQDGDLIMLGLATHEPHTCLLREEVVFDSARKNAIRALAKLEHEKQMEEIGDGEEDGNGNGNGNGNTQPPLNAAIQSYIHNANYELLHLSVLRDYLALEFETKEFYPDSKFELEPTIDDFVFMTFFVGNDFLPHMPALDIGDEAFDLLFFAYKKNRGKWIHDGRYKRTLTINGNKSDGIVGEKLEINHPYLTDSGTITSGDRLESFLADVGSYEDPYYDNKRISMTEDNERMRKADKKAGRESFIPSQEVLDQVEMAGRELYRDMLLQNSMIGGRDGTEGDVDDELDEIETFKPVTSTRTVPKVKLSTDESAVEAGLIKKLGGILRGSLSSKEGGVSNATFDDNDLIDVKGRYYYDKFRFTPFDSENHLALRKAYIQGLVWNLEYYYKGCVSWDWFYPYHYGPMLSDLIDINNLLSEISFFGNDDKKAADGVRRVAGQPLRPFEQLLGCLPPSSSYLLPEPYRWLMTSTDSPLIDSYPESFTVDMNGKRWPWEAVTLLPFIDVNKMVESTRTLIDESLLTEEEKKLNQFGETYVLTRSDDNSDPVKKEIFYESKWARIEKDASVTFHPELNPGTVVPAPCFPTLKVAPVTKLNRRKIGINVFGLSSRYRTALLEMDDDLPPLPPASLLAEKFIGTTVYFRYPFLHEGFVCSVSDSTTLYRGKDMPIKYTDEMKEKRKSQLAKMYKQYMKGKGMSGSGGWVLPQSDLTLTVRPLKCVETMRDGTRVKVFMKEEVGVPFVAALWSPSCLDPRLNGLPSKLEKNPYKFGNVDEFLDTLADVKTSENMVPSVLSQNASNTLESTAVMTSRGFATLVNARLNQQRKFSTYVKSGNNHYNSVKPLPRRGPLNIATNLARGGDPRRRVCGAAGVVAISAFFFASCLCQVNAIFSDASIGRIPIVSRLLPISNVTLSLRGGDIEHDGGMFDISNPPTPPIEFAHGTTTISFVFQGGIVAAVDSRASIGNFVGSKTTQKVLPVSRNILGTMAGGAADCSFWIRFLRSEAKLHELVHDGRGISVARASRILSNVLYQNRGLDLSVGTMIMGYHHLDGFSIYYVDNTGVRIKGDMFAVGSGSTFAQGILDTEERRFDMSEEEAVALGIRAIRHATLRDAMSGGYIGVYLITKDGWRKVFSEDLASITN